MGWAQAGARKGPLVACTEPSIRKDPERDDAASCRRGSESRSACPGQTRPVFFPMGVAHMRQWGDEPGSRGVRPLQHRPTRPHRTTRCAGGHGGGPRADLRGPRTLGEEPRPTRTPYGTRSVSQRRHAGGDQARSPGPFGARRRSRKIPTLDHRNSPGARRGGVMSKTTRSGRASPPSRLPRTDSGVRVASASLTADHWPGSSFRSWNPPTQRQPWIESDCTTSPSI